MGQMSGKYSQVLFDSCNFLEFGSWQLTYGADIHPTASRSGGGAQKTVEGIFRGSGTINGYLDPDDPLTGQVVSGTVYAISLYYRVTGPVLWTGNARLGPWDTGADREGTPVMVSIPFTTDGLWTPPS